MGGYSKLINGLIAPATGAFYICMLKSALPVNMFKKTDYITQEAGLQLV